MKDKQVKGHIEYDKDSEGFVFKSAAKAEISNLRELYRRAGRRESAASKHFEETVHMYFPESYTQPEYFAWQREQAIERYYYWELSALQRKHGMYLCSWCEKWNVHRPKIGYSNIRCKHCNTLNQFCVPEPKDSDRPMQPSM